jgi:nitrogen fixation NifU-like protein
MRKAFLLPGLRRNNMDETLASLYQERIMDHYRNPRYADDLDCPVGCASNGANPTCGDRLSLALAFDEGGRIVKVSQKAQGCAISVASASLLSEMLIGKTTEEAGLIDEDVIRGLLGVPITINRVRCAMLPLATLQQALANKK